MNVIDKAYRVVLEREVTFTKNFDVVASSEEEATEVAKAMASKTPVSEFDRGNGESDRTTVGDLTEIDYVVNVETDEDYWDCECKEDYIHPKSQAKCHWCGTTLEDNPPDSRSNEVELKKLRKRGG